MDLTLLPWPQGLPSTGYFFSPTSPYFSFFYLPSSLWKYGRRLKLLWTVVINEWLPRWWDQQQKWEALGVSGTGLLERWAAGVRLCACPPHVTVKCMLAGPSGVASNSVLLDSLSRASFADVINEDEVLLN